MAIPATAIIEVRSTGSDTSGGFFNPARAGAGADFSQQDTPAISVTDAVANGTATVTSATAGFSSTAGTGHVGNGVYINGSRYEITAVGSSTSITVDRTITAGTGLTLKVGGALASPGQAFAFAVGGNTVWLKAGTYVLSASSNVSGGRIVAPAGSFDAPTRLIGYTTTRGDGAPTRPVLKSGANSVLLFNAAGASTHLENVELRRDTGAGHTVVGGLRFDNSNCRARNCTAYSLDDVGYFANSGTGIRFESCYAESCTTGFRSDATAVSVLGCAAKGCGGNGSFFANTGTFHLLRCAAINGTANGFAFLTGGNTAAHCVGRGNAGTDVAGFSFNGSASNGNNWLVNCLAVGNGTGSGYGFAAAGASALTNLLLNCAAYGNASGNYNATNISAAQISGFVTLTADPFTAPGGLDFTLNSLAAGGALLRATGWPASLPGLAGSGYSDIGAYQHADASPLTGVKLAADGMDLIGTGDPGGVTSMTTLPKMLVALWRKSYKKTTLTGGDLKTYADDSTTVNTTQAASDTAISQTLGAAS